MRDKTGEAEQAKTPVCRCTVRPLPHENFLQLMASVQVDFCPLHAAAPALYEALKRILADVEAYQSNPNGHAPVNCIANARAALALVERKDK